jgi:hypothetical protein
VRCAGFTRTPYIHSSGGSSCLTLYFDRSRSVRATLSVLGLLIYCETGMQNSPGCMQKYVEYSKVAEHIFLKPYIYISKKQITVTPIQHYESRSGSYLIRRNLLCFWLSPLYHFDIHLNHIQSPGKTKITH